MSKSRIQVSINPVLVERAKALMAARGFDSFSEFLEDLIRQEMDRRDAGKVAPVARPAPAAKEPIKLGSHRIAPTGATCAESRKRK
jgi:hypothetical protein